VEWKKSGQEGMQMPPWLSSFIIPNLPALEQPIQANRSRNASNHVPHMTNRANVSLPDTAVPCISPLGKPFNETTVWLPQKPAKDNKQKKLEVHNTEI